jgi:hypothetical protein
MSDTLSSWTEMFTAPLGLEAPPDLPISLLPYLARPSRSLLPLLEP